MTNYSTLPLHRQVEDVRIQASRALRLDSSDQNRVKSMQQAHLKMQEFLRLNDLNLENLNSFFGLKPYNPLLGLERFLKLVELKFDFSRFQDFAQKYELFASPLITSYFSSDSSKFLSFLENSDAQMLEMLEFFRQDSSDLNLSFVSGSSELFDSIAQTLPSSLLLYSAVLKKESGRIIDNQDFTFLKSLYNSIREAILDFDNGDDNEKFEQNRILVNKIATKLAEIETRLKESVKAKYQVQQLSEKTKVSIGSKLKSLFAPKSDTRSDDSVLSCLSLDTSKVEDTLMIKSPFIDSSNFENLLNF